MRNELIHLKLTAPWENWVKTMTQKDSSIEISLVMFHLHLSKRCKVNVVEWKFKTIFTYKIYAHIFTCILSVM